MKLNADLILSESDTKTINVGNFSISVNFKTLALEKLLGVAFDNKTFFQSHRENLIKLQGK